MDIKINGPNDWKIIFLKIKDIFLEVIILDTWPPLPVIGDYFGLVNMDKSEYLCIIFALYQDMIKIKWINESIVEKANKNCQQVILSYDIYKSSGCCKRFCDNIWKLVK